MKWGETIRILSVKNHRWNWIIHVILQTIEITADNLTVYIFYQSLVSEKFDKFESFILWRIIKRNVHFHYLCVVNLNTNYLHWIFHLSFQIGKNIRTIHFYFHIQHLSASIQVIYFSPITGVETNLKRDETLNDT